MAEFPWQLQIVRALLRGTYDDHSPLSYLRGQTHLLEIIFRRLQTSLTVVLIGCCASGKSSLAGRIYMEAGCVTGAQLRERLVEQASYGSGDAPPIGSYIFERHPNRRGATATASMNAEPVFDRSFYPGYLLPEFQERYDR